jgi:hypothetical protein
MFPRAVPRIGNETRESAVEFALTLNPNPKRQRGNRSTPFAGASGWCRQQPRAAQHD